MLVVPSAVDQVVPSVVASAAAVWEQAISAMAVLAVTWAAALAAVVWEQAISIVVVPAAAFSAVVLSKTAGPFGDEFHPVLSPSSVPHGPMVAVVAES